MRSLILPFLHLWNETTTILLPPTITEMWDGNFYARQFFFVNVCITGVYHAQPLPLESFITLSTRWQFLLLSCLISYSIQIFLSLSLTIKGEEIFFFASAAEATFCLSVFICTYRHCQSHYYYYDYTAFCDAQHQKVKHINSSYNDDP